MRAIRYHEAGESDVLRTDEIDRPSPKVDELLIEVKAASINPVDAKRRSQGAGRLPKTTGSDFAGVVVELGDAIEEFEVGDRVFGTGLHTDRFQQGSFTEYIAVPSDIVAHLPATVDFADGAAGALVGVTAWRALVHHAHLQPGDQCLVHGGSGGVGHIAVQLANAVGASVATTARPEAHETVSAMGADDVFDYARDDLLDAVQTVTGGVDVVLDHRVDDYLQFDIDIATLGGRVIIVGGYHGEISDAIGARSKELAIHMMSMSNTVTQREMDDTSGILARLGSLMEDGLITPHIAATYELNDAREVHRAVMEDHFTGKLVVRP